MEDEIDGGGAGGGADEGGGDAGGGAPDSEDGFLAGLTPEDIQAAADDIDAGLTDDDLPGADGGDDDLSDGGAGTRRAAPRVGDGGVIDQLIQSRYGGDPMKFLDAFYESSSEMKRLSTEVAELKAGGGRPPAPVETPEQQQARFNAALRSDQGYITAFNAYKDAEAAVTSLVNLQTQTANEAQSALAEVQRLSTAIENETDVNKKGLLRQDKAIALVKLEGIRSQFSNRDIVLSSAKREVDSRKQWAVQAQSSVRERLEQEANQARRGAETSNRTAQQYDRSFMQQVKAHNLALDPSNATQKKKLDALNVVVRRATVAELRSRQNQGLPGLEGYEFHELVGEILRDYAESFEIAKRSAPSARGGAPRPKPVIPGKNTSRRTPPQGGSRPRRFGQGGAPSRASQGEDALDAMLSTPDGVLRRAEMIDTRLMSRRRAGNE